MIKSMTGYGKSNLSIDSREYQVEIKTVNHKYIDVTLKIPRKISYLEEDIRRLITSKLKRGKVDITITFENYSKDSNNISINTELAKTYIENLKKLAEEEKIDFNIDITEIVQMPDVLITKNNFDEDQVKQEIIKVSEEAINNLIQMREKEGKKISEGILKKISKIEKKVED